MNTVEEFWDKLLSKHDEYINDAYQSLNQAERQYVIDYLRHMISDPDFLPEQKESASKALHCITGQKKI